jgi:hypothetical protein
MQNRAPTMYAYTSLEAMLKAEGNGGSKSPLPPPTDKPVTERPDA